MKLNNTQLVRLCRLPNVYGVLLATVQCLYVLHPCAAFDDGPGKLLRAGAYAIDITPEEFPVSRNGGLQDQLATSAHDPLHARCLVLDNGETRIAIAVCDSAAIPRDIFDVAKEKASTLTGIPVENMLMSATHTHSAVTVTGVFQSEPDEAYRTFLTEQIAAGIVQAASQLEPARIGWAVGSDATQVFNRRWVMKPGYKYIDPFGLGTDKVAMNPRAGSPELDKPAGPVDPQIGMLSVQSRDGQPIALLANYSLHYVGGVPSHTLSADYFGEFARRITQRIGATKLDPPFVGIMSNGTSGDINNIDRRVTYNRRDSFEQILIVALSVTDAAYRAYQLIEYHDWIPLKMRETEIELGVRLPTQQDIARAKQRLETAGPGPYKKREEIYARETLFMANYPKQVPVKLQAIRIGDLGIVSSPCETFVETGLAIKAQSPLKPTFTIELANGCNGYLPTPEQHALGGYETWRARSSYLAVEAEPKLRTAALDLLHQVAATDPITPKEGVTKLFNGRDFSGLTTWLKENKYGDPDRVFTIKDGLLHITGKELGYIRTNQAYKDYHLIFEFRWGEQTWGNRKDRARDTGVLIHSVGPDGNHRNGTWMASIEAQIIEGGTGDFIAVRGTYADGRPVPVSITAETREGEGPQPLWKKGGQKITVPPGRVDWFGKDPKWTEDELGFRGSHDVEAQHGEWNRMEIIADGGHVVVKLNGVTVNEALDVFPRAGRILVESELAEFDVRRWELWPLGKAPTSGK